MFDTLRHSGEVPGVAEALRNELKASDSSASFLQDAAGLLQPSSTRVAKATFGRFVLAFRWQRWSIRLGV